MEVVRFGSLTDQDRAELEGDEDDPVRQPAGTAVVPQLVMWRRLTAARNWPAGQALLESLPF